MRPLANRRIVGALLATLVCAAAGWDAAAHPPKPIGKGGKEIRGKVHRWLHQAKVPLVSGRVQVLRRGCPRHPEFDACVFSSRPRRVYLRRGLRDPRRLLYHELGHVFDLKVLNRGERKAFKRITGLRRPGWFRGGRVPPAEWFADGYALCAVTRTITARPPRATAYGWRPRASTHGRVCRLIRKAASPRGRPPQRPALPPPVIESPPPPPPPAAPPSQGQQDPCGLLEELLGGCN